MIFSTTAHPFRAMSDLVLASPFAPSSQNNSSPVKMVTEDHSLPDFTPKAYVLTTLQTCYSLYGADPVIPRICEEVIYQNSYGMSTRHCYTRPTVDLYNYNMNLFTANSSLPASLPFVGDHMAAIVPEGSHHHAVGTMDDIVQAMRCTTRVNSTGKFEAPTTPDIQEYLSSTYPAKYPASTAVASGWRNSVNQCLTHGQGWNFLTYPPVEGSKNKRHLLFERAFNGQLIVGSGQCKGFNDKRRAADKTPKRGKVYRNSQQLPSPPITPTHEYWTSLPETPALGRGIGPVDLSQHSMLASEELEMLEVGMTGMPPAPAERTLEEVEADLIRMMPGLQNPSMFSARNPPEPVRQVIFCNRDEVIDEQDFQSNWLTR
jgi:hypothetical protein